MNRLLSAAAVCLAASAHAQSSLPAAFVANNGNIRGSVSAFTINPDGTLNFVQELILGSASGDPGVNAYSISITPGGRFLAASHATSASVTERLSLLHVNANGSISLVNNLSTPDSPLDLVWISDTLLAVTRTRTSGTNEVILYRFHEPLLTITEIDREAAGAFASKLALSPDGRWLVVNNSPISGGASVILLEVDQSAGTLTFRGTFPTGTGYALGQSFSPDGRHVYAGSGAASTQGYIAALELDPVNAFLNTIPNSPFLDAGQSPKQAVVSPNGSFVYVGHGTDGTIRMHTRDADGSLIDQAMLYDVGIQGSLGDIAALRIPGAAAPLDLLLFTDKETFDGTPRGLFSARISPDTGSLTILTSRLDTMGVSPNDIAVWPGAAPPLCSTDYNQDGGGDNADVVDLATDIAAGTQSFPPNSPDFNNDGGADNADVVDLANTIAGGPCP